MVRAHLPEGQGVEGPRPDPPTRRTEQLLDPALHLPGRPLGEGEQEDALWGYGALTDQMRDSVGEGGGLARAGPSEDEDATGLGTDGRPLVGIERVRARRSCASQTFFEALFTDSRMVL